MNYARKEEFIFISGIIMTQYLVRSRVQSAVGQEAVEHEEFVAHAVSGVTADGGADDET